MRGVIAKVYIDNNQRDTQKAVSKPCNSLCCIYAAKLTRGEMGTLKSYPFLGVTWSCCIYFFSIKLLPILLVMLAISRYFPIKFTS